MKCHVCGEGMSSLLSDLPFKVDLHSIVILKDLPVWQCSNCREYLIEDSIMVKVEQLLSAADISVELEIVKFAA